MDMSPDERRQSRYRPLDEKSDEQRFLDSALARIRGLQRLKHNAELAAVLSLVVPGLGQLYLGQRVRAAIYFLPSILFAKLAIPWVVCAVAGTFNAYGTAGRLNGHRSRF